MISSSTYGKGLETAIIINHGLLHGVTIAACATCSAAPDWMEMIWLLCSTEDPAFMVSLSWFSYRLDH